MHQRVAHCLLGDHSSARTWAPGEVRSSLNSHLPKQNQLSVEPVSPSGPASTEWDVVFKLKESSLGMQ